MGITAFEVAGIQDYVTLRKIHNVKITENVIQTKIFKMKWFNISLLNYFDFVLTSLNGFYLELFCFIR